MSPNTIVGTSIFTVTTTDKESAQLYYNMTCLPSVCPFKIFACTYLNNVVPLRHTVLYDLNCNSRVPSIFRECQQKNNNSTCKTYYTSTCIIVLFISAGAVLTESSVVNVTEPGFDLYIYVFDGKNIVGPKVLTVQMKGNSSVICI